MYRPTSRCFRNQEPSGFEDIVSVLVADAEAASDLCYRNPFATKSPD